MTAALKQVNPSFGVETGDRVGVAADAEMDVAAATGSPAKALQDKLSTEIEGARAGDDSDMSARMVTMIVIAACAMTWVGGVLLYATL